MNSPAIPLAKVAAELRAPNVTAQLIDFQLSEPADNLFREDQAYHLDLCLTPRPRNARACYPERWSPHRFERIGKVFLVPPREALQARSDDGGRQTSVVCKLRPELIRCWFETELEWTDQRLKASLDIHQPNVHALLLRLGQELHQPGFASGMLIELVAAQLAIELARYCVASAEPRPGGGLAPWRLRLIDERLREVREAPTLTELAGLCRLSVRQLTRGFRASRSCSIGDYVANSRLDHAKHLLTGGQSVKAIAYSLGFASPSGFCFAFRRATGQTPREFRCGAAH